MSLMVLKYLMLKVLLLIENALVNFVYSKTNESYNFTVGREIKAYSISKINARKNTYAIFTILILLKA